MPLASIGSDGQKAVRQPAVTPPAATPRAALAPSPRLPASLIDFTHSQAALCRPKGAEIGAGQGVCLSFWPFALLRTTWPRGGGRDLARALLLAPWNTQAAQPPLRAGSAGAPLREKAASRHGGQ